MKQIIIVVLVAIAIAGVIMLKKSTSGCKKEDSVCPCKMVESTQSNQTESGTSNSE